MRRPQSVHGRRIGHHNSHRRRHAPSLEVGRGVDKLDTLERGGELVMGIVVYLLKSRAGRNGNVRGRRGGERQ